MKDDEIFKKKLIDYITTNDINYLKANLENCSITALTIIKTEIEIRLRNALRP